MTNDFVPLLITTQDFERLSQLLAHWVGSDASELEEELGRATLVPQSDIPPDVVTMNSRVRFVDIESKTETEMTLVYPKDADATQGRISVMAPIGTALLGLKVGETISWTLPSGKTRTLGVSSVEYQPESAGHWDL